MSRPLRPPNGGRREVSAEAVVRRNCEWLIKAAVVYAMVILTWIDVVIPELTHAPKPDLLEGLAGARLCPDREPAFPPTNVGLAVSLVEYGLSYHATRHDMAVHHSGGTTCLTLLV